MYPLLSVIVFLLSLNMGTQTLGESTDDDFFELCQETRCSTRGGPRIRFPFRLNTQPDFCGLEGFVVSCLNNRTLLHLPFSGDFYVQEISYLNKRISWGASDGIVVPIDCLSYDNNLVYLYDPFVSMNKLPSHCRRFKTVEIISVDGYVELQQAIKRLFERQEIFLAWERLDGCYECENSGNFCGFNSTRNATICSTSRPKRSHSAVILGTSIGGTAFLALVVLVLYRFRRSDSEKETQLKVERFLANYKTLNPSRYSYSDLKKITGKFRHKVGQGGYGTVYRGKLPNGIPAAVKMIEISKGNGQEFINEVATIGRIHHFNVVRLLGFCAEGTRRALVYEFMPNESLEKFIFSSKDAKTRNRPFSWEKLQQIAMGIARGMESTCTRGATKGSFTSTSSPIIFY